MIQRILVATALLLTLGACEGIKSQLGLTKQPPDEFRVTAQAPLSLPPDYNLRPPQPGAPRPQEGTVQQQAEKIVVGGNGGNGGNGSSGLSFGNSTFAINGVAPVTTRSPGEMALLASAGADRADPNIREVVDRETALFNERNSSFLEDLMFWRESEPPGVIVDAEAEAKRLSENAALGKPVVEGETPTIERREKALFEGLF